VVRDDCVDEEVESFSHDERGDQLFIQGNTIQRRK
jgi:hypothetical protein